MAPEQSGLLGRLAVHYKLITLEQLAEATRDQARRGLDKMKLGELLVEKGFLRASQLEQLLHVQKEVWAKQRAAQPPQPARAGDPMAAASAASARASTPSSVSTSSTGSTGGPEGPARTPSGAARPPEPTPVPAARAAVSVPPVSSSSRPAPPPGSDAAAAMRALMPESGAPSRASEVRPPPAARSAAPADRATPARDEIRAPAPSAAKPHAKWTGIAAAPSHVADPGRKSELDALLTASVQDGASDFHLHSGAPLQQRKNGRLVEVGPAVDPGRSEALAFSILSEEQAQIARELGEIDFCYTLPGVGRFRSNVYRQQRGWDAVFRAIPPEPPTLEQLGLPASFAKLTNFHQGMVLVTGPAGCGKSSTMAALVNLVNEERRDHILTVEDPIEYLHPSKQCLVNQRNVKRHTESFARALRAALREDPDVIVIGELRDLETISLAMTAAETGHFVLATLHTNDTIRTINRLVGAFPSDQQGQVRTMLSESLRAVVSQRLVTVADGSRRVPAYEFLAVNKAVGNLIRENKTFQIRSILQTGAAQGMQLLDQSLLQLVNAGTITKEEAARHSEDPKKLLGAAG